MRNGYTELAAQTRKALQNPDPLVQSLARNVLALVDVVDEIDRIPSRRIHDAIRIGRHVDAVDHASINSVIVRGVRAIHPVRAPAKDGV